MTASMTNRAGGSPLRACRSARLLVDQDPAHEQITGLITPPTPPPGHVRRAFGSKALFGSRVMNPDRCSESGRALSGSFGSRPVNPPSRALAAHTGAPPPQRTHPTRYGALTSALERETPRGLWPRGVDLLRLSAGLVVQSERCSASRAERRAFRLVRGKGASVAASTQRRVTRSLVSVARRRQPDRWTWPHWPRPRCRVG